MKERAHLASEFLGFDGKSETEGLYMIYTNDQDPQPGDLVVLENCQGKVFCTIDDPDAWRAKTKGVMQVLRVSRVTYL